MKNELAALLPHLEGGERTPVTTADELDALDTDEIVEGYRDGFAGEPEPGDNRSRSYWHGWRNGAVDGRHRTKDEAQAILATAIVKAKIGEVG